MINKFIPCPQWLYSTPLGAMSTFRQWSHEMAGARCVREKRNWIMSTTTLLTRFLLAELLLSCRTHARIFLRRYHCTKHDGFRTRRYVSARIRWIAFLLWRPGPTQRLSAIKLLPIASSCAKFLCVIVQQCGRANSHVHVCVIVYLCLSTFSSSPPPLLLLLLLWLATFRTEIYRQTGWFIFKYQEEHYRR